MPSSGFDDLSKKLKTLADNARDLGNTKAASLTDVLTPAFMAAHTRFRSAHEFFDASGFDVSSQAAFEAIPEAKLDSFVRSVSSFASWGDMLNSAGAQWAKAKLGF